MIFVGVDGPGLHDPLFVPPDDAIRSVAHALLAGYVAAATRGVDFDLGREGRLESADRDWFCG